MGMPFNINYNVMTGIISNELPKSVAEISEAAFDDYAYKWYNARKYCAIFFICTRCCDKRHFSAH